VARGAQAASTPAMTIFNKANARLFFNGPIPGPAASQPMRPLMVVLLLQYKRPGDSSSAVCHDSPVCASLCNKIKLTGDLFSGGNNKNICATMGVQKPVISLVCLITRVLQDSSIVILPPAFLPHQSR
jgi:hypothetical protein